MVSLRRRDLLIFIGILLLAGVLAGSFWASAVEKGKEPTVKETQLAFPSLSAMSNTFAHVASAVKPAVININTVQVTRYPSRGSRSPFEDFFGEDFFRRYFGDVPESVQKSLGSGVIVDEKGDALTNNHVVANAREIEVVLYDGSKHKAKIIGTDPKTDLAVIRIEGLKKFTIAKLGDSDKVNVGDWVLAIGSPFGLEQTVTAGIVSAKGRVIGQGPFDDFLQTDAAINPGNSGGPLVNMQGEIVGINTAIVASGQGIGFAIPINMAKKIYAEILDKGKVTRGWLGVGLQELNPDIAKQLGLKDANGVLIRGIYRNSPAERAELKPGDVIIEYNGKKINNGSDLQRAVGLTEIGKTVRLKVIRDKVEKVFELKITEASEQPQAMKID